MRARRVACFALVAVCPQTGAVAVAAAATAELAPARVGQTMTETQCDNL